MLQITDLIILIQTVTGHFCLLSLYMFLKIFSCQASNWLVKFKMTAYYSLEFVLKKHIASNVKDYMSTAALGTYSASYLLLFTFAILLRAFSDMPVLMFFYSIECRS